MILILIIIIWVAGGLAIYISNVKPTKNKLKKFIFYFICGPISWLLSIVEWCTDD